MKGHHKCGLLDKINIWKLFSASMFFKQQTDTIHHKYKLLDNINVYKLFSASMFFKQQTDTTHKQ